MAQRRMFSKEITTSDLFVDMPMSSQLLYFHLGMEADDEGFIGNAKMLSRAYGMNNDDLTLLSAKGFVIQFPTGVSVIKDWNINNKIRSDRLKKTIYKNEKKLLNVDTTGSYRLVDNLTTEWQPIDNQMTAQDRLGKDRLVEDSIDKDNIYSPVSTETKDTIPYKEIVTYLNEKAKTGYRASGKKTQGLIKARWKEGFKLDDFKIVIDKKVNQWLHDAKMVEYLRPETLFGTKFESYLNQPDTNGKSQKEIEQDDYLTNKYGF